MANLVKGVLGGDWSLVVGWILPAFLSLELMTALVLPSLAPHMLAMHRFLHESVTARQVSLLAIAAVAGLVLAAAEAPLYRVLEGYALWPAPIAAYWTNRHRARRARLVARQLEVEGRADQGVRSGLLNQRAARYPASDKQFAPTMLGNAIRGFETYAGDRYMLDSQLLWHDLTAAAPHSAVTAVDNARANEGFLRLPALRQSGHGLAWPGNRPDLRLRCPVVAGRRHRDCSGRRVLPAGRARHR